MEKKRYVVMGAGEVGFHLARTLSQEGHDVVVVELSPEKKERVEELDVAAVIGSGAHVPVLQQARVDKADLFMAVSSNDEANLTAAVLAKRLGARRSVVRVGISEDVTTHRRIYEEVFGADLLLSTQLLATNKILNNILGHNTLAVEYLAQGKVQLRKIHVEEGSMLTKEALRGIAMPAGSLVVAYFRGEELFIPDGSYQAEAGDEVLVLSRSEDIKRVESLLSTRPRTLGTVVIGGGGATGRTVAKHLLGQVDRIRIIERERHRAEEIAEMFPSVEVLHGDATDVALLRAERVAEAQTFIALSGNDERNLLASLIAQELGVRQVVTLVERTETSHLWRRMGLMRIVSPRQIACERINEYIATDYCSNIVSLQRGAAQIVERRLRRASPAAGVTLAEMSPPRGLMVGAVVRGEKVFVPRGGDRLEIGDTVILFVAAEHLSIVNLLFPGREGT